MGVAKDFFGIGEGEMFDFSAADIVDGYLVLATLLAILIGTLISVISFLTPLADFFRYIAALAFVILGIRDALRVSAITMVRLEEAGFGVLMQIITVLFVLMFLFGILCLFRFIKGLKFIPKILEDSMGLLRRST